MAKNYKNYTNKEMQAITIAKEIKDGQIVIVGTGLPLIGATVAKNKFAPYGDLNSTIIGDDYVKPKTRFTGSGGANGIATYSNTVIMMQHEKRRFIEKIDYVTSVGWAGGPGGREKLGLPGNRGPLAVVTDKGILRFDEKTKRMYLAGYYPGVTIEDIVENTGFELDTSRAVQLEAPTEEIIKMIREDIDPGQAFIKVPVEE